MLVTEVSCLNRQRKGKLKLGVGYKLFSSRARSAWEHLLLKTVDRRVAGLQNVCELGMLKAQVFI